MKTCEDPVALQVLLAAEPRLARLVERAQGLRGKAVTATVEEVFAQFRQAIAELVGWERPQSRGGPDWLFDSRGYDLACAQLRAALDKALQADAGASAAQEGE